MQKKDQGLDFLIKKVSISINKSPEQLQPFFKILKSNWYETEQDLKKLTIQDYQKMKIPHRVAQAITQQLKKSPGINNSPVQKSQKKSNKQNNTLDEKRIIELANNLRIKLLAKLYDNRFDTRSVIQILYKIIANIVKDPYEMKFRTLKKSNNLIQQNVVQHQPCLQFICAIGFEDNGQTLTLSKFQVPQLIFVQDCLNQTIVGLGGTTQHQKKHKQSQQNMFLNVTKFPNNEKDVKQQFSQQKLAQVKYVDALEKLVQIRNKIMSQAPTNRRLRIYHKRFQTKDVHIQQTSFQQQFQKSDDQVIAGYWKQIVQNNAKSQRFQSKRKLQFQYLIKQKIHKQTLIKVKLPNQLIIQAYFGPLQKLSQVFRVVAQIVVGDLYLFTAPPKKIMDKKQLQKTLIELDAVPMASFYLSSTNDIFYIQQKYVQYIQQ